MNLSAQQVMLQGFYWDVPVNSEQKEGIWYKNLESKLSYLKEIGITGIWCPPPSKGNWGIYDMGYGIYDHYDLGDQDQIGTVSTRFGTKSDLDNLISKAHQLQLDVYADVVLNHMYSTQVKDLEPNPIIKNYLLHRKNNQCGYPVNELRFAIEMEANQTIKITVSNPIIKRSSSGYRLKVSDRADMSNANQLFHPIKGKNNPFGYWESIADNKDVFTYYIYQNPKMTLWLQLEVLDDKMQWGDQTNGLTITRIEDQEGKELEWKAYSFTKISPKSNKLTWDYKDFHPSTIDDYLLNYPDTGGIVASSKLFGHDFDHNNTKVNKQLKGWGHWLLNDVGYDGVRLDFVNGIESNFIKEWTDEVVGTSRFCVTEFFTFSNQQIVTWNNDVNTDNSATVKSFDFPLKKLLTDMCNDSTLMFDMTTLVDAGLVKYLPSERIITFAENHDTGKEHDKWIKKDWDMAYAYILFHEPTPCLFYSHLFPTVQEDFHSKKHKVEVDSELPPTIEKYLKVRSLLHGAVNPCQELTSSHRYIASRVLKEENKEAILIINNSNAEDVINYDELNCNANEINYIDAINSENEVIYKEGKMTLTTPSRGTSLWIPKTVYNGLFKYMER